MPDSLHCERCAAVSKCPLRVLSSEECGSLSAANHSWCVLKRRIIYAEGTPADVIYMLCSGSVKLVTTVAGDERIATIVSAGEWFGLDALLPEQRRSFTAIAREASVLCCFDHERLAEATHNVEFIWWYTRALADAANAAQRAHVSSSGQRVRKRVLNALADCHARTISLKSVELAQLLGVSPETISRSLRRRANRSNQHSHPRT